MSHFQFKIFTLIDHGENDYEQCPLLLEHTMQKYYPFAVKVSADQFYNNLRRIYWYDEIKNPWACGVIGEEAGPYFTFYPYEARSPNHPKPPTFGLARSEIYAGYFLFENQEDAALAQMYMV
jgi:hypothetical protein